MNLIHTDQRPAYMAEMVAVRPPVYQSPSSVSVPSVMSALLPGTVYQTIFSLSQTLNISRNFSKLSCLLRNFNSFIHFIVRRNMI